MSALHYRDLTGGVVYLNPQHIVSVRNARGGDFGAEYPKFRDDVLAGKLCVVAMLDGDKHIVRDFTDNVHYVWNRALRGEEQQR